MGISGRPPGPGLRGTSAAEFRRGVRKAAAVLGSSISDIGSGRLGAYRSRPRSWIYNRMNESRPAISLESAEEILERLKDYHRQHRPRRSVDNIKAHLVILNMQNVVHDCQKES